MLEVRVAVSKVIDMTRDLYRLRVIEGFFIVGSWARGEQVSESDIDIVIIPVMTRKEHLTQYLRSKCALDGIFSVPVIGIVENYEKPDAIVTLYDGMGGYINVDWFYIPSERIHGFIVKDADIIKPYIEITRRLKVIYEEK